MRLKTNLKQLFFIDGLGALITAFFLSIVLVQFESAFGMPKNILYTLAAVPVIFALYSFSCYYFLKANRPVYLMGIAICNLLYCCVTIWLISCYYEDLTILGLAYFILELIIIVILVIIEIRSARTES